MANDRSWEYVSNEKLTRQHRHLFSCRPFPFSLIFNFLLSLSFSFSLSKTSRRFSPLSCYSGVFAAHLCHSVSIPTKNLHTFAILVSFLGSLVLLIFYLCFFLGFSYVLRIVFKKNFKKVF
ncbi:hypothetical protein ACOSQ2_009688 [Xanthoceras sorbifolium]